MSNAKLLASSFASNFSLLEVVRNEFIFEWPYLVTDEFVVVLRSHVEKTFGKMDVDSGTGPDGLFTHVLKECAHELALPLAKLIRQIISQGTYCPPHGLLIG